jgi:cysteine desulfurase/selenocysteine lyase
MLTLTEIRNLFPALSRKVYGKDLVYLDNAATSQRVQTVLDEWNRISAESNANIHRAVHCLADEATQAYEAARDAVKEFLNASAREEIVFTSGTTASINLVAFCYGEAFVKEGDEVVVFGGEGGSVVEMAEVLGTIPYEVMTSISTRVKRIYVKE